MKIIKGSDIELTFGGKALKFEQEECAPKFKGHTFRGSLAVDLRGHSPIQKISSRISNEITNELNEILLALLSAGIPASNIKITHRHDSHSIATAEVTIKNENN